MPTILICPKAAEVVQYIHPIRHTGQYPAEPVGSTADKLKRARQTADGQGLQQPWYKQIVVEYGTVNISPTIIDAIYIDSTPTASQGKTKECMDTWVVGIPYIICSEKNLPPFLSLSRVSCPIYSRVRFILMREEGVSYLGNVMTHVLSIYQ
jgi:hypothetical protein